MAERRSVTLTEAQKRRHAEIRRQVTADKPRLVREATEHRREREALIGAMQLLKREREARGLSLSAVAEASGIDKGRLSKLENDPFPNPTLATLIRIADAIGVRLTLQVAAA